MPSFAKKYALPSEDVDRMIRSYIEFIHSIVRSGSIRLDRASR